MRHHIRTFSATTFQMVMNQVFGLLFFIGMAMLLPKALFGQINWAIAVGATITIIGSLGFDHVIVRKLSGGASVNNTVGVYITHTLVFAILTITGLLIYRQINPRFFANNPEFIYIFIGLLGTFMSMPYKQLANGTERFWYLAGMGISGNVIRVVILLFLFLTDRVTPGNIAQMFLISGILEWGICALLGTRLSRRIIWPLVNFQRYKNLVQHALPQMGVILLDSAFARIDWILMGIISTDAFTADYSFSYKAFESSRLPLLIIAPIILPKVSRLYSKGGLTEKASAELNFLWRAESLICIVIPLMLNVCWEEIVNLVTHNQYGASTKWVYAVLSLSVPMAYIINFLWTIAFAQGRLKMTFYFTAITLACNVILNLSLIPLFGALGSALAFTGSTAVQMCLYIRRVREPAVKMRFGDFIKTAIFAVVIVIIVRLLPIQWIIKIPAACLLYAIFAWLNGMIDWRKPFILQNRNS